MSVTSGAGGITLHPVITGNSSTPDHNLTLNFPFGWPNMSSVGNYNGSAQGGGNTNLLSDLENLCCVPLKDFFLQNVCDKLMSVMYTEWDSYLKSFELAESPKIVLTVLYSLIIFTSLTGNSLVLLTFAFNRHMRSATNVFIMSLAVSDLLLTLTTAPFDIGVTFTTFWEFGSFSCKLVPFMTNLSVSCSSLTLCCIAFDRFYALVYPFKVKFFQSPLKAFALLLLVWVLSIATNLPQAQQHELVPFRSRCETKYLCMQPLVRDVGEEIVQTWLPFILLFLLPLMIMTILYGIIIHRLWFRRPIGTSIVATESSQLKIKKKAIKMLLMVVFLFVVCWLPLQCFVIISQKSDLHASQSLRQWRMFLQCLAVSSCCYNPAIYTLMNDKFRKNFLNVLLCRRIRVHPLSTNSMAEQQRREYIRRKIPRLPTHGAEEQRSRDTVETRL